MCKKKQSVKIMSGETDWTRAHMGNQCVNLWQEKKKKRKWKRKFPEFSLDLLFYIEVFVPGFQEDADW